MTTFQDLGRILDAPIPRNDYERRSTAQRFIDAAPSDLDMLLEMCGLAELR